MKGMGQFNSDFYQRFRPYYPTSLFEDLETKWIQRKFVPPFSVADIGCGTGHSTFSILQTGLPVHIIGIDPDPGMLQRAEENKKTFSLLPQQSVKFTQGQGEWTGLKSQFVEAILIGSAFHWMDPLKSIYEFHRILKPGGWIRIFEYQFPKALHLPELNHWIRRQFNLYWKAPGQIPRGSLKELTQIFRNDPRFEFLGTRRPPMKIYLDRENLVGLILSQSRVLHFEATLNPEKLQEFRKNLDADLKVHLGKNHEEFDFNLSLIDFGLRTKSRVE